MSDIEIEKYTVPLDEAAFTDIYNRYWEKVFAICYAHLEDAELAKEMVQDIFKSLWERRDVLEFRHSPERYLVRSAKLKVFEHIRNKQIRASHLQQMMKDKKAEANVTEDSVMHHYLAQALVGLVDALPENCRCVFRMSRELGLSNKEIAQQLLISERTVEYRLSNALKQLRLKLHDYIT